MVKMLRNSELSLPQEGVIVYNGERIGFERVIDTRHEYWKGDITGYIVKMSQGRGFEYNLKDKNKFTVVSGIVSDFATAENTLVKLLAS